MWTGISLLAAILLGFLAGLFSFRVKSRWCTVCGATMACVDCRDRVRTTGPRAAQPR
jgi:hypothetical protein